MFTATSERMTSVEYLAWEDDQDGRHEFFRGEVFAMAGGSLRHNALTAAITVAMRETSGEWHYRVVEAGGRITLAKGASIEIDAVYEGVLELEGE